MAPKPSRQRTLKEALRALAAAPDDPVLLGEVVGLSLPYVEQGAESLFKQLADEPRGLAQFEQAVERFLVEKFGNRRFIESLVKADFPEAFLATSAHNLADSLLKERGLQRDTEGLSPRPAPGGGDRTGVEYADPSAGHEEKALVIERNAAMRRALDGLPIKDRVLLKVLFACGTDLDDEEAAFVTSTRGVSPDVLRDELAARTERMDTRELELRESVEERASYIRELQERRHRMARIIAEMDGGVQRDTAPGTLEIHVTQRKARAVTPEWRASQLAALDVRIAQWERLLQQDYDKLTEPLHGRPNYREVALMLGYASPEDGEQKLSTAANTVQVDAKRLLAKIGDQFCGEDQ